MDGAAQQLQALRAAINVLYTSPNRSEQHQADTWLQEFRSTPEAWLLCLELLSSPDAQDHEAYFAANSLRYSCSKGQQLIAADVLAQLLPKMALCLLHALAKSRWAVASQLSTAVAVLVLRSASWAAQSIIPDLEKLMLSQFPVFQQMQGQDAAQQPPPQQPTVAHVAMLEVLAALPAACNDKMCSVHPNRRLAVSEALAMSSSIQPWIQAAFLGVEQSQPQAQQLYLNLGLQLVHGWCELGNLPIVLPQQVNIVQHVCVAALRAETAAAAAEAMVSMLTTTKDVAVQGSDELLLLVQTWQDAIAAVPLDGPAAAQAGHDVLQAVCSVLCAAAGALLPFSLGQDANLLKSHFMRIAEQLLRQLTSDEDDVALTALEFWQDTYITTLQGLSTSSRQSAISSHTSLLQHLTAGLVLRAQLDATSLPAATADIRDLPEEVRMVRRELGSALREITSLVGVASMSQYMASLVQSAWQALCEGRGSAPRASSPGTQGPAWTSLECALWASNVVLGQAGKGKRKEAADAAAVQVMVEVTTACLLRLEDPAAGPKLLGTALTLLGGLASWFVEHPEPLRGVLPALSLALKSPNDKLSRNAATTVYRLCQHAPLATLVLEAHQPWVEGVLQLYSMAGGVQRRIGSGSDFSTEELLLASLCRLAMHPTSSSLPFGSNLLMHLTEPRLQELRQALAGLVACAPMALQMLAAGGANTFTPAEPPAAALQPAMLDALAQSEFARATACAAQAGVCLDVLHMVTENATVGRQLKEVLCLQSTGNSDTDSAQGDRDEWRRRSRGAGGGGGEDSSEGGESEMSRTSSFTSGQQGPGGGGVGSGGVGGGGGAGGEAAQRLQLMSACNEQVLALVRAVWGILQPCLPQLQSLHAVMGPACVLFGCALHNLPAELRPDVQLLAVHLLSSLPPRVLVLPKALALLVGCLHVHVGGEGQPDARAPPPLAPLAAGSFVPQLVPLGGTSSSGPGSVNAAARGPGVHLPPSLSGNLGGVLSRGASATAAAAAAAGQPPGARLPALGATLLGVTQAAIIHSCQQAVLSSDPDLVMPTLGLCSMALSALPQVLTTPTTLEAMVGMTRATARSYDVEQCKQWLDWVPQLLCAPYKSGGDSVGGAQPPPPQLQPGTPRARVSAAHRVQVKIALGSGAAAAGGQQQDAQQQQQEADDGSSLQPLQQCEGLAALAQALEAGGAGAQIVYALLLAAAGDMPPDLAQLVAVTLHQVWQGVGTHRFSAWLNTAVMELAQEPAPWVKLNAEARVAALQELVNSETEYDVGRFKKSVRALCGGPAKKLTVGISSLPGSRSLSRRPSNLNSMQMSA